MKQSLLLSLFIAFLFFASCNTSPTERKGFSEQDISSIEDFFETHDEYVLAADWASLAMQYTEDAIRFPPGGEPIKGRKNIGEGFKAVDRYTDFKADLLEIDGQGDFAYTLAKFSATFILEGSSESMEMSGTSMVILKRDKSDSWHLHRVLWN